MEGVLGWFRLGSDPSNSGEAHRTPQPACINSIVFDGRLPRLLLDQRADHFFVECPVAGEFFAVERLNMAVPVRVVLRKQPQDVLGLPQPALNPHALLVVVHLQDR